MMSEDIVYRILEERDWQQWKEVRLEALRDYPQLFTPAFEEECCKDDAYFVANIRENKIFGAFISDRLVSTVGLMLYSMAKMKHRGSVFGVYTTPSARGKGLTKTLFEMVIADARKSGLVLLQLDVACVNDAAIKLYEKLGFRIFGTEVNSLIVGGEYVDQHLMALHIK